MRQFDEPWETGAKFGQQRNWKASLRSFLEDSLFLSPKKWVIRRQSWKKCSGDHQTQTPKMMNNSSIWKKIYFHRMRMDLSQMSVKNPAGNGLRKSEDYVYAEIFFPLKNNLICSPQSKTVRFVLFPLVFTYSQSGYMKYERMKSLGLFLVFLQYFCRWCIMHGWEW